MAWMGKNPFGEDDQIAQLLKRDKLNEVRRSRATNLLQHHLSAGGDKGLEDLL